MAGDDVPVKFTLTADEQEVIRSMTSVDAKGKALTATYSELGRTLANVEKQFSSLSRTVNFQGGASRGQIASQFVERMTPAMADDRMRSQSIRAQRVGNAAGMVAEVNRLRQRLESDPAYAERMAALEVTRNERLGGDKSATRQDRGSLTNFMRREKLGDTSDELLRMASRVVRDKLQAVDKAIGESLRATGGNVDILKLASAKGVSPGNPQAVQQFIQQRAAAQQAEATAQADAITQGQFTSSVNDVRSRTLGYRSQRFQRRAGRGRPFDSRVGANYVGAEEGESPLDNWSPAARAADADVFDNQDDLLSAEQDRRILRSNRMAKANQLRQQRTFNMWSKGAQIASVVAGVGVGAILGADQLIGNYNQRVGGDYLDALSSIEPTFRPLMSIGDNALHQGKIRGQVLDSAIAYGRPVGETSDLLYDIQSSAGNLSEQKQRELNRSTLQLASVTGGELPIIGKAMTTVQELYGDKLGSTDRSASMIKKAIDYGKFSATGFAQLAPEALSTSALFKISPEDALATLAVTSTRSGRDQRLFTGASYLFSKMGDAAKEGIVDPNATFIQQLRQLRGASSEQLLKIEGREGLNVASNARDMVDEIANLSTQMKGTTGRELSGQQANLLMDPVNALSSIAQSVGTLDTNGLQMLMQQGGNNGLNLAGDAIVTRLALAGQKASAPEYLAAGGQTMMDNLQAHKQMYAESMYGPMRAAYLASGDPRDRMLAQELDLAMGKVVTRQTKVPNSTFSFDARASVSSTLVDTASTGSDIQGYTDLLRNERLGPEFTSQDYGEVMRARSDGREADARAVIDRVRRKQGPSTTTAGAADSFSWRSNPISQASPVTAADIPKITPKQEDAANQAFIQRELKNDEAMYARALKSGDVYTADAYRSRGFAINSRIRALRDEGDDGFTATDARTVANEIRSANSPTAANVTEENTKSIAVLTKVLVDIATKAGLLGGPTTPNTNTPTTGTQPPNIRSNPVNP